MQQNLLVTRLVMLCLTAMWQVVYYWEKETVIMMILLQDTTLEMHQNQVYGIGDTIEMKQNQVYGVGA